MEVIFATFTFMVGIFIGSCLVSIKLLKNPDGKVYVPQPDENGICSLKFEIHGGAERLMHEDLMILEIVKED